MNGPPKSRLSTLTREASIVKGSSCLCLEFLLQYFTLLEISVDELSKILYLLC